ncbi:hypothetical protein HVIM_04558 (plasmid) [Roseomonas mucosa]|nr:hypothetical protein HVIM_04558 [Roseomonas mucosa]
MRDPDTALPARQARRRRRSCGQQCGRRLHRVRERQQPSFQDAAAQGGEQA